MAPAFFSSNKRMQTKLGYFLVKDMQTQKEPLLFFENYTQCSETNEKSTFQFLQFFFRYNRPKTK